MLIICYFTGCISQLSVVLVLNKITVFIHLEAPTGDLLKNSCPTSALNQLKYGRESSAEFSLKLNSYFK